MCDGAAARTADLYFKSYGVVARGNPNYFITYGNGKSGENGPCFRHSGCVDRLEVVLQLCWVVGAGGWQPLLLACVLGTESPCTPRRLQPRACKRACALTAPTAGTRTSRRPSERAGASVPHACSTCAGPPARPPPTVPSIGGRPPPNALVHGPPPRLCTGARPHPPPLTRLARCREWSSDQAAVLHYTYNRFRCGTGGGTRGAVNDAAGQSSLRGEAHRFPALLCLATAATSSPAATAATAPPRRRTPSAASSCPLTGACG